MANIGTNSEISKVRLAEGTIPSTPASGYGYLYAGTTGYVFYKNDGGTVYNLASPGLAGGINFIIDGGGTAISAGIKGDVEVPFTCTINQVSMYADQSGTVIVDIWKDTYANFPPTDADSITASAVPTISGAAKSQDATLTGWTTSIAAGDILRFNVDSAATIERVTLALKVTRS